MADPKSVLDISKNALGTIELMANLTFGLYRNMGDSDDLKQILAELLPDVSYVHEQFSTELRRLPQGFEQLGIKTDRTLPQIYESGNDIWDWTNKRRCDLIEERFCSIARSTSAIVMQIQSVFMCRRRHIDLEQAATDSYRFRCKIDELVLDQTKTIDEILISFSKSSDEILNTLESIDLRAVA